MNRININMPRYKSFSNAEALEIAEATFRFQFQEDASERKQEADAYFLTLFSKDPLPNFLKRFAGQKPPVMIGSEFLDGKGPNFSVSCLVRIDQTKLKVLGGHFETDTNCSSCIYMVELLNRKWVVTDRISGWSG